MKYNTIENETRLTEKLGLKNKLGYYAFARPMGMTIFQNILVDSPEKVELLKKYEKEINQFVRDWNIDGCVHKYRIDSDSTGTEYKVTENGTYYHIETSDMMVGLLEKIRKDNTRVRLHWGDVKTGKDWGDVYDVKGRVGRSTGRCKIPILVHNARSMGGGAILTHCIVKIVTTKGSETLYQHPNYYNV